jgi:two-component system, cell cycle sensor histidine kinase and response regulator CckA
MERTMSQTQDRRAQAALPISLACGYIVVLMGTAGYAGWFFHIAFLRTALPGLMSMKANTAICLWLIGISLVLLSTLPSKRFWIGRTTAWAATFVAFLTFAEYIFRHNFGIDELIFRDRYLPASPFPGRMAPLTALSLGLLGVALLFLHGSRVRLRGAGYILAVCSGSIGLVGAVGYLYTATSDTGLHSFTTMALHTALGIAFAALGLLCSRPQEGVVQLILSHGAGGAMARRLLPVGVVTPLALGWLEIWGSRLGYYGADVGLGVSVLVLLIVLIVAILVSARSANISEQERRLAEQQNRDIAERGRSDRRFRGLLEAAPDAMVVMNHDDEIVLVNLQAERVFGYSRDELIGKGVTSIIPLGFGERVISDQKRTRPEALAQQIGMGLDLCGKCKDGSEFPIEIMLSPLESAEEVLVIAAIRDISTRKKQDAEIRRMQKMEAIGRLAGGVAHDFNNLLTAIIGHGSMLRTKPPDPEFQLHVQAVLDAADTAAEITKQLLSMSGKRVLAREVFSVNERVKRIVRITTPNLRESVRISMDLDWDAGDVQMSPAQFDQMLLNLVLNAGDAMPEGGSIQISSSCIEKIIDSDSNDEEGLPAFVRLLVSDSGEGFSLDALEHLYEPFYSTKRERGTGLGLSLVYGIVHDAGGTINMQSGGQLGTCFEILLPRVVKQTPAAPGLSLVPSAASLPAESITILIAEDDSIVRQLVECYLTYEGYQLIVTENGQDALNAAATYKGHIDLLLSDVRMPDMDGPTLARHIAQTRPDTKTLLMSGFLGESADSFRKEDHLFPFIQKPFVPSDLASKIMQICRAS